MYVKRRSTNNDVVVCRPPLNRGKACALLSINPILEGSACPLRLRVCQSSRLIDYSSTVNQGTTPEVLRANAWFPAFLSIMVIAGLDTAGVTTTRTKLYNPAPSLVGQLVASLAIGGSLAPFCSVTGVLPWPALSLPPPVEAALLSLAGSVWR